MRHARVVVLAAAAGMTVFALGTTRSDAQPVSTPAISLASGSYVVFKGTNVQCLTFGPIAKVPGKRGIVCFVGPPKTYAPGTYWAVLTPTDGFYDSRGSRPVFRAVTSATRIHSKVTTTGGSLLRVTGTDIGCFFQPGGRVDPGHKALFCTDVDSRGPVPQSAGFALSDRYLVTLSFGSDRGWHIEGRYRHSR